uniref:Uncharacterized protein n=1 Tax=Myoviridae sp. ctU4n16 TaxID=2826658 RepID=A0A8S5N5B0_9CAUD|nr:MAG TPA: hypothetical protein [Myoviridae sp. ctU4n16]
MWRVFPKAVSGVLPPWTNRNIGGSREKVDTACWKKNMYICHPNRK